ncbi:hypothetical protein OC834_007390 [Tilletia horrida]|nr:hypothetical protein OC834_007390 [Tilletia horrida]
MPTPSHRLTNKAKSKTKFKGYTYTDSGAVEPSKKRQRTKSQSGLGEGHDGVDEWVDEVADTLLPTSPRLPQPAFTNQQADKACGKALQSLGICYDIGCKLAVSPRMMVSLQAHFSVTVNFVVSIFHVYGHDFDCQVKYNPRRCPGFGWTDGESLERLWSSLRDLISLARPTSKVNRRQLLALRLSKISHSHLAGIIALLNERLRRMEGRLAVELLDFTLDANSFSVSVEAAQSSAPQYSEAQSRSKCPSQSEPTAALSGIPQTPSLEIDLPAQLQPLVSRLDFFIKSRRQVAFDRKAVHARYKQRLDKLVKDFALTRARFAPSASAGIVTSPSDSFDPAVEVAQMISREKIACQSLSEAALALHTPLTQWHGITDQMARRDQLPSTHLLTRHSTSKSTSSSKSKTQLANYNKAADDFNTVLSDNVAVKAKVMSVLQASSDDPHFPPSSSTASPLASLQHHHPPLPARCVSLSDLFKRETLDMLAPLIDPADLAFQPWAMDPTLAAAMDQLERIYRLYEEIERLNVEVHNAIRWISGTVQDALQLQGQHRPRDHHVLIDRRLRMSLALGLHWLAGVRELSPHSLLLHAVIEPVQSWFKDKPSIAPSFPCSQVATDAADGTDDNDKDDEEEEDRGSSVDDVHDVRHDFEDE